jgi:hypothetical protein
MFPVILFNIILIIGQYGGMILKGFKRLYINY